MTMNSFDSNIGKDSLLEYCMDIPELEWNEEAEAVNARLFVHDLYGLTDTEIRRILGLKKINPLVDEMERKK
jgi:hypothetical protein